MVAGILLATLAVGSFAQRARPSQAEEDESAALPASTKAAPRSESYADWDVWRNLTIGPGQSVTLDSGIRFGTTGSARVSVRSRNRDLPNLVMDAYWAVPEAEFFNVAEVATGDMFPYPNVGGAVFTTYGTQFRLRLTNTGNGTMFLSQVVIFARIQ
jgi:hypothetical protein